MELKNQIVYRDITKEDISPALLEGFIRRQVVTRSRRRIGGEWRIVDTPFIDDWDSDDFARKLRDIGETISTGGYAAGAFLEGRLKGFALVCAKPLGSRSQYLDLDSMHVSADVRRRGIGRRLFLMAAEWAGRIGAEKLYISAQSSVETQAFYSSLGCVDAAEPDDAHVKDEPFDCQLEYLLDGALVLAEPSEEYAEQIMEYRREFLDAGDSMDGTSGLRRFEEASGWLEWCRLARDAATCSKGWVPDAQYLTVRNTDGRLVGMIDIRLGTNSEILDLYGQIGYSIRPSERGQGYSVRQLRLALDICRGLGMERVLVTCDADNTASARTIIKNGGVLENEVTAPDGRPILRYRITL